VFSFNVYFIEIISCRALLGAKTASSLVAAAQLRKNEASNTRFNVNRGPARFIATETTCKRLTFKLRRSTEIYSVAAREDRRAESHNS